MDLGVDESFDEPVAPVSTAELSDVRTVMRVVDVYDSKLH